MKIMTVVGARPNFMKAAPIIKAIAEFNAEADKREKGLRTSVEPPRIQHVLVHTGQHYDAIMSDTFFEELQMPRPNIHLGVGSGSHGVQTADILRKFEEILRAEQPDALIVVGDVNSTAACALAAVKLSTETGAKRTIVAHVESGLRSFDRSMPEEHNRVVTDHLADLLFVTEPSGLKNLTREGISPKRIHFVGNTMIDTLLAYRAKAEGSKLLDNLALRVAHPTTNSKKSSPTVKPFALLTLHRPANVDNRESFSGIIEGIAELSKRMLIVFPAHPRTSKRVEEFGLGDYFLKSAPQSEDAAIKTAPDHGILMIPPCGYLDFVCLMKNARIVITDSGGIQEETTCLAVPCVTVRENTERPVTITAGTNVLAGVKPAGIRKAIRNQLAKRPRRKAPEKWDGKSAQRIVAALYKAGKG